MTRPLRVFLCHASQDKPAVRELYNALKSDDWIDPWLDKAKILPGQDWEIVIEKAVDDSDVVIICLSSQSVSKEGFVQREIRYAYDIALEKPEETIFLIPLRLDDCNVPRKLKQFHWVDYFGTDKKDAFSDLLNALKLRYDQKMGAEEIEHEQEKLAKNEEELARQLASEIAAREKVELKVKTDREARVKRDREQAKNTTREPVKPNSILLSDAKPAPRLPKKKTAVKTAPVEEIKKPAKQGFSLWAIGLAAFVVISLLVWSVSNLGARGAIATQADNITSIHTPELTGTLPITPSPTNLTFNPTVDIITSSFADSSHADVDAIAFTSWNNTDPKEVPVNCGKCHTTKGFQDYLVDGVVNSAVLAPPGTLTCETCHDSANFPNRYTITSVVFPSSAILSLGGSNVDSAFVDDDSNLCVECHQGRESTTSINNALKGKNADTVDAKISIENIHYLGVGATLFGNEAKGVYQYDGKDYRGQNMHADEEGKMNKCNDCHDVHTLEPKLEDCMTCHDTRDLTTIRENDVDYDGDGDVTEGIAGEIETLKDALFVHIQIYASLNGGEIDYKADIYPYFYGVDGKQYVAWTPRLFKAAFNYQYVQKDRGAYVHNPKYIIQILIDAIEDLSGDVTTYTRPEVP